MVSFLQIRIGIKKLALNRREVAGRAFLRHEVDAGVSESVCTSRRTKFDGFFVFREIAAKAN